MATASNTPHGMAGLSSQMSHHIEAKLDIRQLQEGWLSPTKRASAAKIN